jgi:purine nucleosidase
MKPVILDVDTGMYDALAIAYALNSPELEVIGLTTCFGNGLKSK